MPMIFVLRLSNSDSSPAIVPSSVVQTGVKFFGWENRTAQPSPIQSWKLIGPCVVSAVKSGAVSLMRKDIGFPFSCDDLEHYVGSALQLLNCCKPRPSRIQSRERA